LGIKNGRISENG
jgi:hypothetical protein